MKKSRTRQPTASATTPKPGGLFNNLPTILFGVVWIDIWSVCTMGFDGVLVYGVFNSVRALAFPSTVGMVTVSKLETVTDSDGDRSYRPQVEYDYQIGSQKYHSDRISAFEVSGMQASAREVADRFPVGKPVRVYYNPSRPDRSLLERGIQPMHLFMAMFMTPFNLIWLGSVLAAYSWLRPARTDQLPYGAFLRDRGFVTELRIYNTTPLNEAAARQLGLRPKPRD